MRPLLGRWPRTVSESRLGSHEKQASEQCFSLAFGHLPPACCPCFLLWLPSVDCDLGYMKQTNLSPHELLLVGVFYHSNRKPTDTYWRFDPWDRRRDWCFRWSFDRHIHAVNKYTQIHVQKESVIGGLYLHTDKGTTKQDLTLKSSGSDCDYQLGKGRSYRVYQVHPDVT